MRRTWLLVVGLGVVVAVGLWLLVLRDTTTPVAEADVRIEFEGVVGTSPGEPGIYRYESSGFETIDALAGARHDYPDETFMTISTGPCGPTVRWFGLRERWIEWEHCGPDLGVTATVSYHEWFGIPDLEEERCVVPRPVTGPEESVTTVECVASDSTELYVTMIVGSEFLEVDEESVLTTHLRRTSTLGDGSEGTTQVDIWRLAGTPLVVRMEVERRSVTPSAAGDVTYTEVAILHLSHLDPEG
jgi:hypothetical protein